MNFIEFFYLACYFSFLTTMILVIQIYSDKKQALTDEETHEELVEESESPEELVEESESEQEFVMTENPLFEKEKEGLRHRNVEVIQSNTPEKQALKDEETHEEL
jgi:hypothetical protein